MKIIIVLMLSIPGVCFAAGKDHWSLNKNLNLPTGVATTQCTFVNDVDPVSDSGEIVFEIYKIWLKGWVSAFSMYTDWDIRTIEENEYVDFIREYCNQFPSNTIGMAAHTFTYRIKK